MQLRNETNNDNGTTTAPNRQRPTPIPIASSAIPKPKSTCAQRQNRPAFIRTRAPYWSNAPSQHHHHLPCAPFVLPVWSGRPFPPWPGMNERATATQMDVFLPNQTSFVGVPTEHNVPL
ncbi:hypothetical protein NMY22_g10287 [Coprinellus aureogranulatus]|nr:hypothetical protein NMY22_g10287 [Coprinellus aureogranulatus]